jgi:16S rRNA (cytidine1402-2'-O)-methyltransferase
VATGTLAELAERYRESPPKGEIVIVIGPPGPSGPAEPEAIDQALRAALARQPLKSAVAEVSASLGLPRKSVYARALELKGRD